MNWLTFAVLSGGIILLGLAIVFLLFAEIVGKSQDTSWRAKRIAALKSRPAPNRNVLDPGSSEAAEYRPDTEVSGQEKIALQTSGGEKHPEARPAVETPPQQEKSNPTPH
jgi:hypothetical protein